ncbi:right-handed parallel beta-helix repeat-containing protein [Melittangium boletus]|uniref:right-handed parallel beta-helix repeat-containing protein n=1 Tax=Melittangium boletus TaxID=83453 RepID=UPI003DA65816
MRVGACAVLLWLVAGSASAASVRGTLSKDTTWTLADSPYSLTGDVVIPPGVTLTVEPGVAVYAHYIDGERGGTNTSEVELIVRGTLRTLGTASSPVSFQINTGSWQGVRVESGGTALLSGTTLQGMAAVSLEVTGATAFARVSSSKIHGVVSGVVVKAGGALEMDHTLVEASITQAGLTCDNCKATLLSNTFKNSGVGVRISAHAGNHVTLRDNIIVNGGRGISREGTANTVVLSHNNVWNNGGGNYVGVDPGPDSLSTEPLFVSVSDFHLTSRSPLRRAASDGVSDLGALPYVGNATGLLTGALFEDTTLSGNVRLDGDLIVPRGVTLTLEPGTRLTASSVDYMRAGQSTKHTELIVRGTLRVAGTAQKPVTLRLPPDVGGNWYGLRVEAGGSAVITHTHIADTIVGLDVTGPTSTASLTRGVLSWSTIGAQVRDQGTLVLDHVQVHTHSGSGVRVEDGHAQLLHDTIALNRGTGVEIASRQSRTHVTVRDSLITDNKGAGISRLADTPVTLSHNDVWNNTGDDYRGIVAGPFSLSFNPLYVGSGYFDLTAYSPARRAASDGVSDLGALPYRKGRYEQRFELFGSFAEDTWLSGVYSLKGDLLVPRGVTVTVEPGTRFGVSSTDSMTSGADRRAVEVIVQGTLIVKGSRSHPVLFQGAGGRPGGWRGLRVEGGSVSRLEGVLIRDATYGLEVTGEDTAVAVSSSELTANVHGARVADGGTLALEHTWVHANAETGVTFDKGQGSLLHDTVVGNGTHGVHVLEGMPAHPITVRHCILTSNPHGIRSEARRGEVALSRNNVWNSTLADTSGVARDPGSLSVDPRFVYGSFQLQPDSPCRGAGENGEDLGALW